MKGHTYSRRRPSSNDPDKRVKNIMDICAPWISNKKNYSDTKRCYSYASVPRKLSRKLDTVCKGIKS